MERLAEPYVWRRPGRPPKEGYEYVVELDSYKAEGWRHAQRIILVVVDKPHPKTGQLEIFPFYFFLVTNRREDERSASEMLFHYRRRGTFEDRIGELSQAIAVHLSSPRFEENEVNLLLSLLAFNFLSMLRGEAERAFESGWDLGRFQRTVLKVGARVVKQGRRLFVDIAQAARPIWQRLIRRISRWSVPSSWAQPRGPTKRPWTPPPRHAHLATVLRH